MVESGLTYDNPTKAVQGNKLAWRINEEADKLAAEAHQCEPLSQKTVFFPDSKIMVSINDRQIQGSVYESLTDHVHSPVLEEYLCSKFGWTKGQFHYIHWEAMEIYVKRLPPTKETKVIKLLMNWQNDNHQNHLFDRKNSNLCPACDKETEDHMHFLSCSDKILRRANKAAWNKVIRALKRM